MSVANMGTLRSICAIGVVTTLVMSLPETAAIDAFIDVKLDSGSTLIYQVQFSSDKFILFHDCMCGRTLSCRARYNEQHPPNLPVNEVIPGPTGGPVINNNYRCKNEPSQNSLSCLKLQGNPPSNYVKSQSYTIARASCSPTCVTIYWFNENEKLQVNNTSLGYKENCTSPSTTRPETPSTSPGSTNSTMTFESNDDDSSTGVIVGVVVAIIIIIVIVAIVVGIIFWRRRRPPPKRQSWPNLEANSNNTTSLDDALNYRYRQHPAAAQEDTSNNNLHYGNDSNFDKGDSNNGGVKHVTHSSTDAVKKTNGTVEKHDYTEVDVTSKRGNNIVKGNISASGYDFADVPEEDKPQAKDGGKRVAVVPGNKKKADDNGTGEDSDYSVIDDSEDKAKQDSRGGSTSLYSTAKTDDDFGYSTVKDNNQVKTPANLNNSNKSQGNISTPQNTAYSLAGNTENTISKDSNSTTPHIYSTFHDDNSQPQNPYNVLPDAEQDPQTEPPLSMPSSNPTNPNIQPSRYSMANPMLDASFDKTAGNSIEIITLPPSASK